MRGLLAGLFVLAWGSEQICMDGACEAGDEVSLLQLRANGDDDVAVCKLTKKTCKTLRNNLGECAKYYQGTDDARRQCEVKGTRCKPMNERFAVDCTSPGPEPEKTCASWCGGHQDDWCEKCTFDACSGCSECPASNCNKEPEETCSDEIKNQDETGIDCGGVCDACPTCSDNKKNQGEEKKDCGGPNCPPCDDGGMDGGDGDGGMDGGDGDNGGDGGTDGGMDGGDGGDDGDGGCVNGDCTDGEGADAEAYCSGEEADVDPNAYPSGSKDGYHVVAYAEPYFRSLYPDLVEKDTASEGSIGCCGVTPADAKDEYECPGRGSDCLCGYSYTSIDDGKSGNWRQHYGKDTTFAKAKKFCEDNKLRLCTLAEVHNNELSNVEPFGRTPFDDDGKFTIKPVWTSTLADHCGNGKKAHYEMCDDGNLDNGDGCSSQCTVEAAHRCASCETELTGSQALNYKGPDSCCEPVSPVIGNVATLVDMHTEEIAKISRALVNAQTHVDELNRKEGNSGVYAGRQYFDSNKLNQWDKATYVSDRRGPCGVHNHADHINTVGMADCGMVLNGYHFRTRHNDYSLASPASDNKAESFNVGVDLEWPEVPNSVKTAGNADAEIEEMREYWKSFINQDYANGGAGKKTRDYRPFFQAKLCYIEGWLEYSTPGGKLDDPFKSERHELESATWHDLMDKVRTRLMAGEKSNLENAAYLPQLVVDVVDGKPVTANFQYSIKCHALKDKDGQPLDVPHARMRQTSELSSSNAESRRQLFELDPLCSKAYNADTPFTPRTGKQMRLCKDDMGGGSYLDELMAQIPGKDNYGAKIYRNDKVTGKLDGSVTDALNGGDLNRAYYNHMYKTGKADANGESLHMRGFHDQNLYVAETTNTRIVSFGGRRFSWAMPFEILYLTPLKKWNPYNILIHSDRKKGGPRGCDKKSERGEVDAKCECDKMSPEECIKRYPECKKVFKDSCALKEVSKNNHYATPRKLWGEGELNPEQDKADTSGSTRLAIGDEGTGDVVAVTASGVNIMTPAFKFKDGKIMNVRTRWPIFPLHDTGSTLWKEVKLIQAMLAMKGGNFMNGGDDEDAFHNWAHNSFPFLPKDRAQYISDLKKKSSFLEQKGERWSIEATDDSHSHTVDLSREQLDALDRSIAVRTRTTPSEVDGHSHVVELHATIDMPAEDHEVNAVEHPAFGGPVGIVHCDGSAGDCGHELGHKGPIPELVQTHNNGTAVEKPSIEQLMEMFTKQQKVMHDEIASLKAEITTLKSA